jgi:hypothetical protein
MLVERFKVLTGGNTVYLPAANPEEVRRDTRKRGWTC